MISFKVSDSILGNKKLLIFINISFWTFMWLIAIWNSYKWAETSNNIFEWKNVFLWSFPHNLTALLLSLGVYKLYLKTPLTDNRSIIIKHLGLSIISGFIYKLFFGFILTESKSWFFVIENSFFEEFSINISNGSYFGTSGMLIYWLVLLVLFAIDTYEKFKNQQISILTLENKHQQAKMKVLRMQIQPHFLFNSFNVIGMKAREGKNKTVVKMIAALSDILRITLNLDNRPFTTLKEELELVKKYLKIEKIRFKDRLKVNIKTLNHLNDILIPSLLLQPLVENSFKHGIAHCIENALLEIDIKEEKNRIIISIFNSGPQLKRGWSLRNNIGIGLRNTTERLKQYYDDEYDFKIYNSLNSGVNVEIQIPLKDYLIKK